MAIEITKKEIENKTKSITHSLSLVTVFIVLVLCISQSSGVFYFFKFTMNSSEIRHKISNN